MKFYDCTMAPSPRRVRIFLAEKRLSLDTVQVDLVGGENLKAEYRKVNPRGLVPALILDDGTCIGESFSICRYLEELHPDPCLMGRDPVGRALVDSRTRQIETEGFIPGAEVFRNTAPHFTQRGIPGVDGVPAIAALAERGLKAIPRFFDALEDLLAGADYLATGEFTVTDITALCVVDFFGWVKQGIPETHVRTQRWYQSVSTRSSAKA